MHRQNQRNFNQDDQDSWKKIYTQHSESRDQQIYHLFAEGLETLKISGEQIPNLFAVNQRLKLLTGFEGVFVDGLEKGKSFYRMLSQRQFPIGNFIRSKEDLTYTPEPDIVHDLYGHLPFLANQEYADFCQKFGKFAVDNTIGDELPIMFERFFWFTLEFGLIKTKQGRRVFGAGIASSIGECAYALSQSPEVIPFNIDLICHQDFRIDEMQRKLFVLEDTEQLYQSLPALKRKLHDQN